MVRLQRCSNCGQMVECLCATCWRCAECNLDCHEHMRKLLKAKDGCL